MAELTKRNNIFYALYYVGKKPIGRSNRNQIELKFNGLLGSSIPKSARIYEFVSGGINARFGSRFSTRFRILM
jgi:hypothetical protein